MSLYPHACSLIAVLLLPQWKGKAWDQQHGWCGQVNIWDWILPFFINTPWKYLIMFSQGYIEWHWYLPTPPRYMPAINACGGPRSNTAATDRRPRVFCTWATVHCGAQVQSALGSLPCHHLHQPLPTFPAQGHFDQDGSVLGHLLLCPLRLPTPQASLHLLLVTTYSMRLPSSLASSLLNSC